VGWCGQCNTGIDKTPTHLNTVPEVIAEKRIAQLKEMGCGKAKIR
jgi:hypothetical protein